LRRERLARYIATWRDLRPFTDGNALKAQGLQPGPCFGKILARLRVAWLDGAVTDREGENVLLAQLIEELEDDCFR
jgi:tRNA nucleotidyltransferase (CCA-adding enzyme)